MYNYRGVYTFLGYSCNALEVLYGYVFDDGITGPSKRRKVTMPPPSTYQQQWREKGRS